MRTTLFALALLLPHAAAATTFVIGNEPFELEFEANPKTIRQDENGVRFVPATWIFWHGCWAYCHPAVFESVTK